jgi:replicative DNA helicase
MSIQQIRSRAFAHKRKFGLDMLAVDHIKLVERPSKTRIDPVERAYENARDLKALAKDLNCVVIGLCQFTKAARQKEHPEPEMDDFYGGSLEEHADIILANFNRYDWLARNPPMNNGKAKEKWDQDRLQAANKIEVFKLKDRFGSPRDRKIFDWDGRATMFRDRVVQADLLGDLH